MSPWEASVTNRLLPQTLCVLQISIFSFGSRKGKRLCASHAKDMNANGSCNRLTYIVEKIKTLYVATTWLAECLWEDLYTYSGS